LHEVKLHIDSFDESEQLQSMGIKLARGLESIELAKKYPVKLGVNHPLRSAKSAGHFVRRAREIEVDCNIVEMFGEDAVVVTLEQLELVRLGYVYQQDGCWLHAEGLHRVFTKRCGQQFNSQETYFVGVSGVRRSLKGASVMNFQNQFEINLRQA
jgi:hypothetical protein